MKSDVIFYALADFLQWTLKIYDVIGNVFNYAVILLGFVGLFYWLNKQRAFNAAAEKDPNQIK